MNKLLLSRDEKCCRKLSFSSLKSRLLSIRSATLILIALSSPSYALDRVIYQLDWLPGGDKAPIYAGIRQGFFKDAGIDVEISSGRGSTDALTKLATKRSDIGSAGLGALLSAKAQQNIPVTGVASIFTKGPHAFMTFEGSGIHSVESVKNKKIATSPFTSSNIYLPLVLEENQLSIEDTKLVYADPGALGPMLSTGRTDAIIAWMTDVYRYQLQLDKTDKKLVVIPWSEAGMDIYGISLVASDDFLAKRPDVARRFVKAFLQAIAFVNREPDIAAENVHSIVTEVSVASAKSAIIEFNKLSKNSITEVAGYGVFEQERLQNTWQWVAKAQELDLDSLDLDKAVTGEFLPLQNQN